MQNFKKISIIIVNYKSKNNLKACVASIFNKIKIEEIEILIMNNDRGENISEVLGDIPEVTVVNLEKNVGFGKAINAGAKIARGEWLMLLNPDTRILTNQEKMFSFFEANPEAGIISPKLIKESGETQKWSTGAYPNLLNLIGNNLGLAQSSRVWESRQTRRVDWVSGAAMVIKKDVFDKIGGFDENIFMYYEDIDLCKKVRQAGKYIFYFPQEKILHLEGKSSKSREKQKKDYYKSQDYYFRKHFGENHTKLIRLLRNIFIKQ